MSILGGDSFETDAFIMPFVNTWWIVLRTRSFNNVFCQYLVKRPQHHKLLTGLLSVLGGESSESETFIRSFVNTW